MERTHDVSRVDWPVLRAATGTRGPRDAVRLRQRWFGSPFGAVAPLLPASGTLLDLGCGFGVLGACLALGSPERQVLGLDVDPRKIARGRAWYGHLTNLRLEEADLADAPLPESEGAVLYDVLHHLEAPEDLLARDARALTPGGILVVKENDVRPAW